MAGKAAPRIAWAVETLDPQPGDRVLEIGCGHGIAVSLIAPSLATGKIVAIDRSPKMIPLATQRNLEHIDAGTVKILQAVPGGLDPDRQRFDKILAIHIGLFQRPKPGELETVRNLLAAGGRLLVGMQPLAAEHLPIAIGQVSRNLERVGLSVERVAIDDSQPVPCACIVASAS